MTTIYLVRHTEYHNPEDTCGGRLPFPLSETGVSQAKRLQLYFADKNIAQIYASAVARCQQTAEIISNGKLPITNDIRILETFTARQGAPGNNGYNYFGYRHLLGGESNQDISNRVSDFFRTTNWEDGKNYLIVSHGDPLYMLYLYLAKLPLLPDIELGQPFPATPGYQSRGSIRVITRHGADWQVGELIENSSLH